MKIDSEVKSKVTCNAPPSLSKHHSISATEFPTRIDRQSIEQEDKNFSNNLELKSKLFTPHHSHDHTATTPAPRRATHQRSHPGTTKTHTRKEATQRPDRAPLLSSGRNDSKQKETAVRLAHRPRLRAASPTRAKLDRSKATRHPRESVSKEEKKKKEEENSIAPLPPGVQVQRKTPSPASPCPNF